MHWVHTRDSVIKIAEVIICRVLGTSCPCPLPGIPVPSQGRILSREMRALRHPMTPARTLTFSFSRRIINILCAVAPVIDRQSSGCDTTQKTQVSDVTSEVCMRRPQWKVAKPCLRTPALFARAPSASLGVWAQVSWPYQARPVSPRPSA